MKIILGIIHRKGSGKTSWWKGLACLLWLGFAVQGQATVLFDDTFSDGERLTQNQPNSLHWYTAGPSSSVSVSSATGLTFLDTTGGHAAAMAYFTPADLDLGASLTLSFTYTFQQIANGDNNFMFGLYDSGGLRLTSDNSGLNSAIFNKYTGYAASGVFGNDPSGPGRDHIEVRNKVGNNLRSIATYSEGLQHLQSGAATPGETYMASLQISRTSGGIVVESTVGSTAITQIYADGAFTRFDTVGIFGADTGLFMVDNIKLDYVGTPEPSPFWALMLVGGMVGFKSFRIRVMPEFRKRV